jgi:hypothetical protein
MYMISSNSGWFNFNAKAALYYIKNEYKQQPNVFSYFQANTGLPWIIKPVYGWISDSFFPFKYR